MQPNGMCGRSSHNSGLRLSTASSARPTQQAQHSSLDTPVSKFLFEFSDSDS